MKDAQLSGMDGLSASEKETTYNPIAHQKAALAAALVTAQQRAAANDFGGMNDILHGIRDIALLVPALNIFPLENARTIIEVSKPQAIDLLSNVAKHAGADNSVLQQYYKTEVFPLIAAIVEADPTGNQSNIPQLLASTHGDEEMIAQLHAIFRPTIENFVAERNADALRGIFKALASYKAADIVVMTTNVALERSGTDERLFFIPEGGTQCLRYVFKGAYQYYTPNGEETNSTMPVNVLADLTKGTLTKQEARTRVEQETGKWTLVI